VAVWADHDPVRARWLADCLARHVAGDWGELDRGDWVLNDLAVRRQHGRVLSDYPLPPATVGEPVVWVITDDLADPDTTTTLLWPSQY
jgi:hypothetical protein